MFSKYSKRQNKLFAKRRNYSFGSKLKFGQRPIIIVASHLVYQTVLISLFTLATIGLIIFGLKNVFVAPKLVIFLPDDNFVTDNYFVKIAGQTDKQAQVKINDQLISEFDINTGGFAKTLPLQLGLNVIKITAQKPYSSTKTIYRKIMVVKAISIR